MLPSYLVLCEESQLFRVRFDVISPVLPPPPPSQHFFFFPKAGRGFGILHVQSTGSETLVAWLFVQRCVL